MSVATCGSKIPTTGCSYKLNITGQDPTVPWHGGDQLITDVDPEFTIVWLYNNGILNIPGDDKTDPDLVPRKSAQAPAAASTAAQDHIHPIFRYSATRWRNISKADYDSLLKPVLLLASCFLEDSLIVPFFRDLMERPLRDLGDKKAQLKFQNETPMLYTFGRKDPTTSADEIKVWQTMANMANCLRWQFNDDVLHWAEQTTVPDLSGLAGPKSSGSAVYLSTHWLAVLRKNVQASDFMDMPSVIDNEHALLRTRWHMAKTLVHEFCHCLHAALFERENNQTLTEPFYFNDRIAEVGLAFEQVMFNSYCIPIGHNPEAPTHPAIAYGMKMFEFPGLLRYVGIERCSPAKFAERTNNPKVMYSKSSFVQMEYVHRYFTKKFWEVDVMRSGSIEAFHIPPNCVSVEENNLNADPTESPLQTTALAVLAAAAAAAGP